MARAFFDTNVLLYLLSDDTAEADKAEELLAQGDGLVSVQVLNEFAVVAHRKAKLGWPEVREALSALRAACQVVPLTTELHEQALGLAERYGYSFYDCLIVAAALGYGCDTLYSEDMQDGQRLETLTLRNPFGAP